ncbi:hypothetical protein FOJ82_04335 [Tessaracoccus rhinocerotis]|uniref:Uncharacterized protein n=1 Tax=Tessaracoccus rhinocerotis TaxID=1689449 RepID=A0A553K5X2_9ACTN|nr:hypothetical protein [Tessaracoccus rhinocerotis]TRY20100.1 hypothetical protein FOJ82_04335 [Tessaracoccus rhinocerotis]
MHTLRLFAISIDAVRDIFGADPALAERLRAVAAARFAPPTRARPSGILGLFRRDRQLEVDPSRPLVSDVEALLAGGYISPDRTRQCWLVLLAWLEELSTAHAELAVRELDTLEFDLARAGLHSDNSLRNLAARQLGTILRPLPGQTVGYAKHSTAVDTLDALVSLGRTADEEFAAVIARTDPVRDLLTVVATGQDLDVVVVEVPPGETTPGR